MTDRDRRASQEALVFTERELRLAREFEHEGVTTVRTNPVPIPSAPAPVVNESHRQG